MEQQAPKNKVYESFKTILIIVYFPFHILLTHFFRLFGRILRIFHKSKINNLADKILQYTEKEEYAKAIECCLEIIESIPKEYRVNNISYLSAITNLGDLYRITANYKESEKLLLEALNVIKPNSYEQCTIMSNLGSLYADMGKFKDAEENMLAAYNLLKLIPEDPSFENVTYNLYTLYEQMGQHDKANKYLKESQSSKK